MNYKSLSNSTLGDYTYKIIPIRKQDMESIRIWRNSQMKILRQKKIISADDQNAYFENTLSPCFNDLAPSQLIFSYLKNDILIGYGGLVNISWIDKRAEMSFLVNTDFLSNDNGYKELMSSFIKLIKRLVFVEMKFNRVFTETYEFRMHHISVLESNGFVKEGCMRGHIFENEKFNDAVLHGVLRSEYDEFK